MNRRDQFTTLIAVLCAAVFIAVQLHGAANRVFRAAPAQTIVVATPDAAALIWQQERLKGRLLLLFDKYPHINGYAYRNNRKPPLNAHTFVEYAITHTIVRSIYYIVPEDEWHELYRRPELKLLRPAPGLAQGEYLFNLLGTPVIATTLRSLPHLGEKPLIYINATLFDRIAVMDALRSKQISSDCVVVYNGGVP